MAAEHGTTIALRGGCRNIAASTGGVGAGEKLRDAGVRGGFGLKWEEGIF